MLNTTKSFIRALPSKTNLSVRLMKPIKTCVAIDLILKQKGEAMLQKQSKSVPLEATVLVTLRENGYITVKIDDPTQGRLFHGGMVRKVFSMIRRERLVWKRKLLRRIPLEEFKLKLNQDGEKNARANDTTTRVPENG